MIFDAKRIKEGIESYNEIMRQVNTPAFCSLEFRKLYNGFYRLRQKPSKWYDDYYSLFLECKTKEYSFKELLTILYKKTGEIHPSFCSKMLATLNPDKPIWDQYVLLWLGFSLKKIKDDNLKIEYYSNVYDQIEKEYLSHLEDRNIKEAIALFDKMIPEGKNISSVKKIDFMLWSNRSDRTISVFEYNKLLDEIDDLKKEN